jgi:hypothetical protein
LLYSGRQRIILRNLKVELVSHPALLAGSLSPFSLNFSLSCYIKIFAETSKKRKET